MARILIVEDEERIASFVSKGLRADGHLTTVVGDGRDGLDHALSGDYDLVVLDIGLPASTASRCSTSCARRAPGPGDRADRPGLGRRHVSRPRGRRRRLHAQAVPVRRAARPGPAAAAAATTTPRAATTSLDAGGVSSTYAPGAPTSATAEVDLSAREFALAEIFMINAGQVLSREQLLDHVWGLDFDPGSNVVDVYVGYLRKKFGADASPPCAGWATASTASGFAAHHRGGPTAADRAPAPRDLGAAAAGSRVVCQCGVHDLGHRSRSCSG